MRSRARGSPTAEDRVIGCDSDVGGERELERHPDTRAVNGRDDGLVKARDAVEDVL
jgi:hypothetical protein